MPSTTPVYKFPYPVGTDRVTDGDNAIQALAERVENIFGALFQAGVVVVTHVTNVYAYTAFTFPRPFPGLPTVMAVSTTGDMFATVIATSPTGATVGSYRPAGPTSFPNNCLWLAFYPGAVSTALEALEASDEQTEGNER